MNNNQLNLARAWRSKTFDEIVGQELAVRLVKNSLFRDKLFPVYLIAGQRGCGKTTLARVFAAAINCAQRDAFAQKPLEVQLPCLTCASCIAMAQAKHPDFYEIDAASHTGVDNVRSIIEVASYLPVLGKRKIYLIDEAHMLSKAAFNAFLKILEEPPMTAVFMLATTDPHKIIDTVRSRCFHLYIEPISFDVLAQHLAVVCKKENIPFDDSALLLIAQESEGSVRDALNRIEQMRMAYDGVFYKDVIISLGDISYECIVTLCQKAFVESPVNVIQYLNEISIEKYSANQVWKRMVEVLRAMVWVKQGFNNSALPSVSNDALKGLATHVSLVRMVQSLDAWYKAEPLFVKTQAQHGMIEMLLLKMHEDYISQSTVASKAPVQKTPQNMSVASQARVDQAVPIQSPPTNQNHDASSPRWKQFIDSIAAKQEPLILSIFKQGIYKTDENNEIVLLYDKRHVFFKELIDQTQAMWKPILAHVFGSEYKLTMTFEAAVSAERETKDIASTEPAIKEKPIVQARVSHDFKDEQKWNKLHTVLKVFPGTVTEERSTL